VSGVSVIGSIVGHAACTGAAVLGGKHLAEHIDEKIVGVRLAGSISWHHHHPHLMHSALKGDTLQRSCLPGLCFVP